MPRDPGVLLLKPIQPPLQPSVGAPAEAHLSAPSHRFGPLRRCGDAPEEQEERMALLPQQSELLTGRRGEEVFHFWSRLVTRSPRERPKACQQQRRPRHGTSHSFRIESRACLEVSVGRFPALGPRWRHPKSAEASRQSPSWSFARCPWHSSRRPRRAHIGARGHDLQASGLATLGARLAQHIFRKLEGLKRNPPRGSRL